MSDSESIEFSRPLITTGVAAPASIDPAPDVSQIPADGWPTRIPSIASGSRARHYQSVVRQSVLDAIHGHGKSVTSVEVCGVLVGNVFRDEFGPYLHVNSSIRGDRAKGHAAQVTFTAETWSAIQAVMDQDHPDERIVGWYHTHPGFGVFLSGMDLFIQDHFFNLPWQVAFVYDPISGDEGMFHWREGKADRQPFLIELDSLLLTSDHLSREMAPTLAEVEASEMAAAPSGPIATLGSPPPAAPIQQNHSSNTDYSWSTVQSVQPRRSHLPMWLLGAFVFVVSFGCTLWAMFSINDDVIVVRPHIDHAATQAQGQAQGQAQSSQRPDQVPAKSTLKAPSDVQKGVDKGVELKGR